MECTAFFVAQATCSQPQPEMDRGQRTMCAPTPDTTYPPLPVGVFYRVADAQSFVDHAIDEGIMPACFEGRLVIDTSGRTCRLVSTHSNGPTYTVMSLYRNETLRHVALRALRQKLAHAAKRNVQRENSQPTCCFRVAILDTLDGVQVLVDAKLAREGLQTLSTLPTTPSPIELKTTQRPEALAPS